MRRSTISHFSFRRGFRTQSKGSTPEGLTLNLFPKGVLMKKIIVSACLLGRNCKYSGGNNRNEAVISYVKGKEVIPVCPEVAAGMPVPRPPVELREGRVISCEGKDLDAVYRAGVARTLKEIEGEEIACAILKAKSPTCGVHEIYDGTFSGKKIKGRGILAEALVKAGIRIIDEKDVESGVAGD